MTLCFSCKMISNYTFDPLVGLAALNFFKSFPDFSFLQCTEFKLFWWNLCGIGMGQAL